MNKKYITKTIFNILKNRGFDDQNIVLKWNEIHPDCINFFPTRMHRMENGNYIVYLKPKDKISAIHFPYVKNNILSALVVRNKLILSIEIDKI